MSPIGGCVVEQHRDNRTEMIQRTIRGKRRFNFELNWKQICHETGMKQETKLFFQVAGITLVSGMLSLPGKYFSCAVFDRFTASRTNLFTISRPRGHADSENRSNKARKIVA